jgi:DNA-binding transcriptional LysR family regulator
LIRDVIQPVCSPKFLRRHPELCSIDGLEHLLHSHYRRRDWADWLTSVGQPELLSEGTLYPNSMLAYEAAIEGIGVAIGQTFLLKDDIATGTLVPLFDRPLIRSLVYFRFGERARCKIARPRSIFRRPIADKWRVTLSLTCPTSSYGLRDLLRAGPFHSAQVKIEQTLALVALFRVLRLAPEPTLLQKYR